MSSEENKRIARRVLQELFEEGNLAAAEELIRPDFVDHEAPPDNPQGPEGLKSSAGSAGCGARCEPRSRTRSAMATRSSPA
jgi:hypothetical protein